MGLLNYNFDSLLLGILRGPSVVGWYNAAYKMLLVGLSVAITYFTGLFPALSRLYVQNREEFGLWSVVPRNSGWSSWCRWSSQERSSLVPSFGSCMARHTQFGNAVPNTALVSGPGCAALGVHGFTSCHRPPGSRLTLRHHFGQSQRHLEHSVDTAFRNGRGSLSNGVRRSGLVRHVLLLFSSRGTARRAVSAAGGPCLAVARCAAVLWFTPTMNWPFRLVLSLVVYLVVQTAVRQPAEGSEAVGVRAAIGDRSGGTRRLPAIGVLRTR